MGAVSCGGFEVIGYFAGTSAPQTAPTVNDQVKRSGQKAVDDLLELRRLGNNWDGEGAVAPLPELVDSAINFVRQGVYSVPPSRVVPINDGRIAMEWYAGGVSTILRIEAAYRGRLMVVAADGKTQFSEIIWKPKDAKRA